jgi:hypothetical protein
MGRNCGVLRHTYGPLWPVKCTWNAIMLKWDRLTTAERYTTSQLTERRCSSSLG